MKYVDSKWQFVADEDAYKLTKLEGQVAVSSYFSRIKCVAFEW